MNLTETSTLSNISALTEYQKIELPEDKKSDDLTTRKYSNISRNMLRSWLMPRPNTGS
jgi:hypothetical protein